MPEEYLGQTLGSIEEFLKFDDAVDVIGNDSWQLMMMAVVEFVLHRNLHHTVTTTFPMSPVMMAVVEFVLHRNLHHTVTTTFPMSPVNEQCSEPP